MHRLLTAPAAGQLGEVGVNSSSGRLGRSCRLSSKGADINRFVERKPRWSVLTPLTMVPLSRAGLPGSKAMVWVGPP